MDVPFLDKIINSAVLLNNQFDIHHETGICAFSSHGYLTLLDPTNHQRNDIRISEDFREISALRFSANGNAIAVGESGFCARVFVLNMDEDFKKLKSNIFAQTGETKFSNIALDYNNKKLVTVGSDDSPFLVLWSLKNESQPFKIGYIQFNTIPQKIAIDNDSTMLAAVGQSFFEVVHIDIPESNKVVKLKQMETRLKPRYQKFNFVDVCFTPDSSLYCLSYEGSLLLYSNIKKDSYSSTSLRTSRKKLTSLAFENNIFLIGNEKGELFCMTKEEQKYLIFKNLLSIHSKVIFVGLSKKYAISVFQNGDIYSYCMPEPKKIMKEKSLLMSNHQGPICKLRTITNMGMEQIVTCGSDNCMRLYELHKQHELISRNEQEMLFCHKFGDPTPNYEYNFFGVRACAQFNNFLIFGCFDGFIHLLSLASNQEVSKFQDNADSVTSLATSYKNEDKNELYLASGGGDGFIRIYLCSEIADGSMKCEKIFTSKSPFFNAVSSVSFSKFSLAASSSNGIKFYSFPDFNEIYYYETPNPVSEISYIEKANLFVSAACDLCISFFDATTGKLFNKYILSNSNYPSNVAVHPSGIVIATALSDERVLILDTITGDIIYSFEPSIGSITSIVFHESDLIVASFTGCIARFNLPDKFHQEIEKKHQNQSPMFDFLNSHPLSIDGPALQSQNENIFRSILNNLTTSMTFSNVGIRGNKKEVMEQNSNNPNQDEPENIINEIDEPENMINDNGNTNNISETELASDLAKIDQPKVIPEFDPESLIRKSFQSRCSVQKEEEYLYITLSKRKKQKIIFPDDQNVDSASNEKPEKLSNSEIQNSNKASLQKPLDNPFEVSDDDTATDKKDIPIEVKSPILHNHSPEIVTSPKETVIPEKINSPVVCNNSPKVINSPKPTIIPEKTNSPDTNKKKEDIYNIPTQDNAQLIEEMEELSSSLNDAIQEAYKYIHSQFSSDEDIEAQNKLYELLQHYIYKKQRREELKNKVKDATQKLNEITKYIEESSKSCLDSFNQIDSYLS